jgi:hypothetical protein
LCMVGRRVTDFYAEKKVVQCVVNFCPWWEKQFSFRGGGWGAFFKQNITNNWIQIINILKEENHFDSATTYYWVVL